MAYEWRGPGYWGPVIGTTPSVTITNPQANDYYYVNLTALNGCTVNDLSQQIIFTTITANFSSTPNCAGQASQFFDMTTINQNQVVNWHWNFGDGTPLVEGVQNPTHTFTNPGTYTVTLTSYSTEGCTSTISHTITVPAAPVPALTGSITSCINGPALTYTTDAGKSNYVWTIPSGAALVSGGQSSDNTATLTWNTVGNFTLGVNYTIPSTLCTAPAATTLGVSVITEPPPVVTGETSVCVGIPGKTYTTTAGKIDYIWYIPPEATVTAGGTMSDNYVTLKWNSLGTYVVKANYTDPVTQCSPQMAGSLTVTVQTPPTPSFVSGVSDVCPGIPGKTYKTQPAKLSYAWTVPVQATITAGGGIADDSVTVTWNNGGAYNIGVNYADPATSCSAASATNFPVTVNPLPVPTITGQNSVCVGATGKTYSTQTGKINYIWNIPPEATLTAGGGSTDDFVTLGWSTVGTYNLSALYTDPVTGCSAITGTPYAVTVNPLPVPAITGENSVCLGVPGKIYTCQAGKTNYAWNIPPQATVTAGGGPASNSVTVTWNSAGTYNITVNYTEPATSCTATAPTSYPVTVNPLPAPVVTGPASVCVGVAGKTYTGQPGKINYSWNVPSQATVTGGGAGTDNFVTVTWNSTGSYNVSLNYADPATSCMAAAPTQFPVTVNALPVPSVSGPNAVCVGVSGKTYTTQPGKLNYVWNIPAEATITAGGTGADNTVTVTWNSTGTYSLTANYTEPATSCTAVSLNPYSVTVNPLPAPAITGNSSVCPGIAGQTYTCQAEKLNYLWSVPPEATKTAGGGTADNYVTLTWNSVGTYNVGVNYTEPVTLCTAVTPASFPVTVNALPVPTITGPDASCLNLHAIYKTEALQSDYSWSIVSGGVINTGATTDEVDVTWNAIGTRIIKVNYVDGHGCTAVVPTSKQVDVLALPNPTITGTAIVCEGDTKTYQTQSGAMTYSWGLPSSGLTVISGGGVTDDHVTVRWDVAGSYSITINYVVGTGCTAPSSTSYAVTVNALPKPQITGPAPVCVLSAHNYTLTPFVSGHAYSWSVTGGTIQAGQNAPIVNILWGNIPTGTLDLTEAISYPGVTCSAAATTFPVVLDQLPAGITGTITGSASVCKTSTVTYSVVPIANASSYQWVYTGTGVTITNNGTSTISIAFSSTATSGSLTVKGVNGCGDGPFSDPLAIAVHYLPEVSFVPCFEQITTPNAKKIILRGGTPRLSSQGVYSGTRVSLNPVSGNYEFDPGGAAAGNYAVTYTYTNTFGCLATTPSVNITVKNNPFSCGSALTDVRDGKKYATAWISGKCWMTENLAYGTALASPGPLQTDNCLPEKYCPPADAACSVYGGIYQWDELMDYSATPGVKGMCPPEWHVPTVADWQTFIDNAVSGAGAPEANAINGSYMKDLLMPGGFHTLMSGVEYNDNRWSFTSGTFTATLYWTSTPYSLTQAVARGLNVYNPSISLYNSNRGNAFPARCVKD